MYKRIILTAISVFILWSVLDYIIHGLILYADYEATAELWLAMEEMKTGLMYFTTFVVSFVFVYIYAIFFAEKGMITGIRYGLLFGLAFGLSMGFGSYAVMPITYKIALVWFLGTVVETALGGLLLGLMIRDK